MVGSRVRKPKAIATPAEQAIARVVLDKLGDRSRVKYSGAPPHVALIASRLREGLTEHDLRAVVGYCAESLEWESKPEMAKYLRPETLFGPSTIHKYLDAARTWAASWLAEQQPARLELVP